MGFLLGKREEEIPESIRSRIVHAAWMLFREKGYQETHIEDVIQRADVTEEEFYSKFFKEGGAGAYLRRSL